ncbi:hypothetical protein [Bordetella sp. LUAb4]|uniref:hypothetical protein n=1 Tax=Bordetella sp. LUAb4 TaxID=2843195 RepID=UPI001E35883A|nr:hypothetical protein [Bordetella sp. LUAb4]
MAGMSSVASPLSGSMLSINEAGLSAESTQARSSGQTKSIGLVDKFRFTMGLMSSKGKRAFRLARLDNNEAKLVRNAHYVILAAEASLNRRATGDSSAVKDVGSEVHDFALRAQKFQEFTDASRPDGMNTAMSEKYGTKPGVIGKIIKGVINQSLEGRGDLTRDAVINLLAGAVDGSGIEEAQNFRENLVAYGNKSSNTYLPGVKGQIIDAFSSAREDGALREMLTADVVDFKKVMMLGEQIRAEKQVSQPLSGRFATKEPAAPRSFPAYVGAHDAQSLSESVADGSVSRPVPPPTNQQLSPTEQSCARVVAQMSSSQRALLKAEVAGNFKGLVAQSVQPADKQNLAEGTAAILRALEDTKTAAEKAFSRYKGNMHHQDLKSLSTTFGDRIPFIKKSWHRGFFRTEAAVMKDYRAVCDKVVSNSRKAFGTFKDEGIEKRNAYYETLATQIAEQFGASLAPAKSKKGAQADVYNVQDRVYRALRNADRKQAYIESKAAAKQAAVQSKGEATPVTVQASVDALQTPIRLRADAQEARNSLNMEVERGVSQFLAENSPVKLQLPEAILAQVPQTGRTPSPVVLDGVDTNKDREGYQVPRKKLAKSSGGAKKQESMQMRDGVAKQELTQKQRVANDLTSDDSGLDSGHSDNEYDAVPSGGKKVTFSPIEPESIYETIDDVASKKPNSIFEEEPLPAPPTRVLNRVYIDENAIAVEPVL